MDIKKSLDAVTAGSTAGTAYAVNGKTLVAWQFKTTGSPTSVSVELQGRLDPSMDWATVGTASTDTSGELIVSGVPVCVREVRLYATTLGGGTAPTITGFISMGS